MRRCLHCLEPACASACPTTALHVNRTGRWPTMRTSASAAGTVSGHARGAFRRPSGTHWRRDQQVYALRGSRRPAACDRSATAWRSRQIEQQRLSRKCHVPACVKACPADALDSASGTRCSRRRRAALRRVRTSMWTTSTARRKRAGRACCISPRFRSRSSASRTSATSRTRRYRSSRSTRCLPRCWRSARCWAGSIVC